MEVNLVDCGYNYVVIIQSFFFPWFDFIYTTDTLITYSPYTTYSAYNAYVAILFTIIKNNTYNMGYLLNTKNTVPYTWTQFLQLN